MRQFTRDPRIDFIRGIAVVAMVIQHVGGLSFLSFAFGEGAFYVSAAEVFVFLSGLVTARAALKTADRAGTRAAVVQLLKRAMRLYALTVILTLVALPLFEAVPLPWAQGLDLTQPWPFVWSVVTLHQTGHVVDIPLMYTLLVSLAALVVALLRTGHARLVVLGSASLWLAYQLVPDRIDLPWTIAGNGVFPFSAWQALFCIGMIVGYRWETICAATRRHSRGALLRVAGMSAVSLVLLFLINHAEHVIPAGAEALLFGKSHLGFGRIVATVVMLGFGLLLTATLWAPLERRVGWFVLPLGRNSLRCYALHAPAVYGAAIFLHGSNLAATSSRELNTVLQLAALLFVWIGVRLLVVHRARTTLGQRPMWTARAPRRLRVARSLVLSLLRV